MAITDHTERSRPSLATDTQPTPNLRRTRHRMTSAEESHQHRTATLDGIAFAHQAVAHLLDNAHAYREAHLKDGTQNSDQINILVKTVHGLFSATYFLNQYAESLMLEHAE